jgi:UTP-glucose-1-phosphate uridylyltransferase
MPKEMLPVVDRPLIQHVVDEAPRPESSISFS